MITREEYNKALDIVEAYHKQLFIADVKHSSNSRKTIDEWINENYDKISGRLIKCLERTEWGTNNRHFTYIDEVNKHSFMKIINNGEKTWREFDSILNNTQQ
jgi:hypothetical protein